MLCVDCCKSVRITGNNFLLLLTRQNLFGCTGILQGVHSQLTAIYIFMLTVSRSLVLHSDHLGHVISANMNDGVGGTLSVGN